MLTFGFFGIIGAIAGAVLGLAGAAFSVIGFQQEQADIQKAVDVQREQNRLEAEARELERERREAQFKKEARIRRGALANAAAAAGVLRSTSFTSGFQGISSFLTGQLQFSQQAAELARRADDLTQASISIDASRALNQARQDLFGGVTQGFGTTAAAASSTGGAELFDALFDNSGPTFGGPR